MHMLADLNDKIFFFLENKLLKNYFSNILDNIETILNPER